MTKEDKHEIVVKVEAVNPNIVIIQVDCLRTETGSNVGSPAVGDGAPPSWGGSVDRSDKPIACDD